jgi:hypothetical protein
VRVKKNLAIVFVMVLASAVQIFAQSNTPVSPVPPVAELAAHPSWEYGGIVQGGFGLTEDRNGFKFLMVGAHLGRVLTPQIGKGRLRGQFEYAVEVIPFWQSYTPVFQRESCTQPANTNVIQCSAPYNVGGTFTGASITPIMLRWNLTSGKKWEPYLQGAGGVLWTNHKYPAFPVAGSQINIQNDGPNADASVWNFTPQGGVGVHYFFRPKRSIDFGANAVHISSASLGDRNPGVNASIQFTLGTSWWK